MLDVAEECTGYKLEDKRSLKSIYSRLIILLQSFCARDGKPGSVAIAAGWFPGIIGAKANGRGAVDTSAAFPVGGLGPGERKPSWFFPRLPALVAIAVNQLASSQEKGEEWEHLNWPVREHDVRSCKNKAIGLLLLSSVY